MIQVEQTPNPNSLKFISEQTISAIGSEEFQKKEIKNIKNIFVKELLSLKGVELILLADNFLSVNKNDEVSWEILKPMVISHINDYFEKNKTPILEKKNNKDNIVDEEEKSHQNFEFIDENRFNMDLTTSASSHFWC